MMEEKSQISKIRNAKRREQQTPWKSRESLATTLRKLYSNNFENLKEMDKFLVTYDHPKLNQEDVNHLNRSITQNEIEPAI
jgi:hypothetical protein